MTRTDPHPESSRDGGTAPGTQPCLAAIDTARHASSSGWSPRASQRRYDAALATIARYHDCLSWQAQQARRDLARQGWHLGPVPHGYRPDRPRPSQGRAAYRFRLAIDPDTAPTVSVIFAWRVHYRLGPAAICHHLNADLDRWPAPSRGTRWTGPRSWTPGAVSRILANPRYTGRQVPHGPDDRRSVLSELVHPPLVSDDTFRDAQQPRAHPTQPDPGEPDSSSSAGGERGDSGSAGAPAEHPDHASGGADSWQDR